MIFCVSICFHQPPPQGAFPSRIVDQRALYQRVLSPRCFSILNTKLLLLVFCFRLMLHEYTCVSNLNVRSGDLAPYNDSRRG
jgi:hypothetical protein